MTRLIVPTAGRVREPKSTGNSWTAGSVPPRLQINQSALQPLEQVGPPDDGGIDHGPQAAVRRNGSCPPAS
jgi:hypothetical protein